jgi:hypothetical protein
VKVAKFTKVGAVMAKKPNDDGTPGGFYIKLSLPEGMKSITLNTGEFLQLKDPRISLDEAVASGRMDQEKADYLKTKIKDFVKFEITHVSN